MEFKELSDLETRRETQKLLLSGKWRMMAESCPITHHPLFLNKDTGEVWSVRLQMPVQIGEGGSQPPLPPSRPAPSPQFTQDVSSRIGQKLMLGWELLDECGEDGAPLMRDLKGNLWSPTDREEVEVDEELPEMREDEELSQRIGQKLLLGWTMLAESCPVTFACPLFLDPITGKRWSAALNDYVDDNKGKLLLSTEQPHPQERVVMAVHTGEGLDLVRQVLETKMVDLAQQLQQTSDLTLTVTLVSVIKQLAETIKLL
ncbi:hypothetical protein BASA81_014005 [Batrachochytrium salamandrivorans]|nr:hypothetical protein BASA81_014005 [Batrachochytrium salamandrivorans]